MEQDEGVGPEVGSSGKSCWRRQVGWIPPVAAEIQDSRSGRWLRRIPLLADIEDLGDSDTFESNNIDKEGGRDVNNSLSDPKNAEPQRIRKVGPARYGFPYFIYTCSENRIYRCQNILCQNLWILFPVGGREGAHEH